MEIKVIIADDHAIIREGLKGLLEKQGIIVVAIAGNGREAVNCAIKTKPDIVLMDIGMPDLNGMEATRRIKKMVPETRVIALSIHSTRNHIAEMFAAGASGYILKECAFKELYGAIQEVIRGNFYVSPAIARTYVESTLSRTTGKETPVFKEMTEKEREILQMIAEGKSTKEMAASIHVSIKTIEAHRRNIMKKLNIFSIAGLTKYAIKEGMVSLE